MSLMISSTVSKFGNELTGHNTKRILFASSEEPIVSGAADSAASDELTLSDSTQPVESQPLPPKSKSSKPKAKWILGGVFAAILSLIAGVRLNSVNQPSVIAQVQEEKAALPPTPPVRIVLGNAVVSFDQQTGQVIAATAGGSMMMGTVSTVPEEIERYGSVYVAKDVNGRIIAYGTESGQIVAPFPEEEHWWQNSTCYRVKTPLGQEVGAKGCELRHVTLQAEKLVVGLIDNVPGVKDDILFLPPETLIEFHGVNPETNQMNNTGTAIRVDARNTVDVGDIENTDANSVPMGQRAALAALVKRTSIPSTRIASDHTEDYIQENHK